ncbi:hypothetical protein D9M68_862960 [compost metagenome]
MPTEKRAAFIMMNMYSSPRLASPTSQPWAPSLSPKASTAVGLPWMPSLCSMEAQRTSLRAPRLPSAFTRNFGTTNSDIPFTPSGAPGMRASTRCTMLSVRSCSP